jgi:hypothetical protein
MRHYCWNGDDTTSSSGALNEMDVTRLSSSSIADEDKLEGRDVRSGFSHGC